MIGSCKILHMLALIVLICGINTQEVSQELVESNVIQPTVATIDAEIGDRDLPDNAAGTVDEDKFGSGENPVVKEASANSTTEITSSNITKVNCLTTKEYGPVEMVNASRLMELLILEPLPGNKTRNSKERKLLPGTCILVLFYARWCIFSSQAAPHFNALPRIFPHMRMVAVDAIKHQSFNTQYGIVGVPTLMLVHNGKPVSKFNGTEYKLETFARFIMDFTTLKPNGSLSVTSADFTGPVPSIPSNETDYCLLLSWIFIASCMLYFTSKSRWWCQFVELIQNTWRESNAQHEHTD